MSRERDALAALCAAGPSLACDLAARLGWPVRFVEGVLYRLRAAGLATSGWEGSPPVLTWRPHAAIAGKSERGMGHAAIPGASPAPGRFNHSGGATSPAEVVAEQHNHNNGDHSPGGNA